MNAVRARAALHRDIRRFFDDRSFLEVETPYLVRAAGTDPYIEPIGVAVRVGGGVEARALHTSPEFAMKELVRRGYDRIFQLCRVWRDGEASELHSPEFTMLEWYRASVGYEAIVDDVEELVRAVLPDSVEVAVRGYEGCFDVTAPFERLTMREVWLRACGIDPIETAGDLPALADAARVEPRWERWDELFFDLMIERVYPWIQRRGPLFVTEWPTPLAALARRCPHDARVAERFELYLGGIELANGYGELTDPEEQRRRFESDNLDRIATGRAPQPIPEEFLATLERGLPPCSGVALGVDRLLMLAMGAASIAETITPTSFE